MAGTLVAAAITAGLAFPGVASATLISVSSAASAADNRTDDQVCTLREAIDAANTNLPVNPGGGNDCPAGELDAVDRILLGSRVYAVAGSTSNEGSNVSGDFDLLTQGGPVVLDGTAAAQTSIDAGDKDRGVEVLGTGSATLSDLTVLNGTVSSRRGGGIRSVTDLLLSRVTVSGNLVDGSAVTAMGGGGIAHDGGTLTIFESTVASNTVSAATAPASTEASGGGIHLAGEGGSIDRSTITANVITGSSTTSQFGLGGGIAMQDAVQGLSITNSNLSGNGIGAIGNSRGGGVYWDDVGAQNDLTVENTTFAFNNTSTTSVAGRGGGIFVEAGAFAKVANSTFKAGFTDGGDGMFVDGSAEVRGSAFDNFDDCRGAGSLVSLGHNVEQALAGDQCGFDQTGDLLSDEINLENPASNGGPTQTAEPEPDSVLIDHIPAAACLGVDGSPLAHDQRGAPRPFSTAGPPACDAGAHETVSCQGALVNVVGTEGDDALLGTAGDDVIVALGGEDRIPSSEGSDRVCAGEGDDFLEEGDSDGDGADFLDGESGTDQLGISTNVNGVTVNMGTGSASGPGVSVSFTSIEDAHGTPFVDTLIGDAGPNVLDGQEAADTIIGGGGVDRLIGQEGADNLFARDGGPDLVDCGLNADTAETDQPSLDSTVGCETLDALPEPLVSDPPPAKPAVPKRCKKGQKLKKGRCVKKKRKKRR